MPLRDLRFFLSALRIRVFPRPFLLFKVLFIGLKVGTWHASFLLTIYSFRGLVSLYFRRLKIIDDAFITYYPVA